MNQHRLKLIQNPIASLAIGVTCLLAITSVHILSLGDDNETFFRETTATPPAYITVPQSAVPVDAEGTRKSVTRYANVVITDMERWELAAMISLEAGNQSAEGQQAVAEVILNRLIAPDFPATLHDVLHQGEQTSVPQFTSVGRLYLAEPGQAQFNAIDAALYGPSILPSDVVFFSRYGENDRVWGQIGDHIFCYGYIWE